MADVVQLNLIQFSLIYLLLFVVLWIMKRSDIHQSKLLIVASLRMTVQLILAGLILTYVFENPHPLFTLAYFLAMVGFAISRVLKKAPKTNRRFQLVIALSIFFSGTFVVLFFVLGVVGVKLDNPQYTIPISGMIIGNSMTGVHLGLKTFIETLRTQRGRIEALLNIGAMPKQILKPYVNQALETAMLPTLNSMLSMGIISLPGMMTGQILSGTLPLTAILYQIAIMVAICTAVTMTVFFSLHFGYKTLYNDRDQILIP